MKFLITLFLLAIAFRIDLIKIQNERLQQNRIQIQKQEENEISGKVTKQNDFVSNWPTDNQYLQESKTTLGIRESSNNGIQIGKISIYSENGCLNCPVHYSASGSAYFKTASGDIFEDSLFTIAHKTIALGSRVKLTNLNNGKMIEAIVNDRGPYYKDRVADLTLAVANALGIRTDQLIKIEIIK